MNKSDFINWIVKQAAMVEASKASQMMKSPMTALPKPNLKGTGLPKPQITPTEVPDKHLIRTQQETPQPAFNVLNNAAAVTPAPRAAFQPINPRLLA